DGTLDTDASDDLLIGVSGDDEDADLDLTFTALGTVEAGSLQLALVDVATAAFEAESGIVFDFGSDTYVYVDANNDGINDDADVLVKLVGGVDHNLLVTALNDGFDDMAV